MGAISSMCCDSQDKSPARKSSPIPPQKKQKALTQTTDKSKRGIQQPKKDIPKQQPKIVESAEEKARRAEQLLKQIQHVYAPPNDKKSVKWDSFTILNKIGSGGFGQVFLAQLKENQSKGLKEKYAIKRVPKSQIIKKKLTANLKLQKKILQQSRSPFITTLFYAFRDEVYLYFVMEWAQGGDTYSLICENNSGRIPKRVEQFKATGQKGVRFILGCLILGMEQLHLKNIMYRDLKPENVLLFENGYAKLTDFGLAKQIRDEELSKTQAGTNIYYAPQMVLKDGYGKEIDLWTIGIYAYEMSNYAPPFSGTEIKDKQRVKRLVKNAQTNRSWKNPATSEELKDFINSFLKLDPKQRLGYNGWDQVKNHKFFTSANFDWKALEQMRMESPIKSIIDRNKLTYKAYNPNQKTVRRGQAVPNGKDLEGWTFVNQER